MRRNNIEFRHMESKDRKPEIIAWIEPELTSCYTLAWLETDSGGYYIKTIGDRFTEHEDTEDVMLVAKYALRSLQNSFDFNDQP